MSMYRLSSLVKDLSRWYRLLQFSVFDGALGGLQQGRTRCNTTVSLESDLAAINIEPIPRDNSYVNSSASRAQKTRRSHKHD